MLMGIPSFEGMTGIYKWMSVTVRYLSEAELQIPLIEAQLIDGSDNFFTLQKAYIKHNHSIYSSIIQINLPPA